MVNLYIDPLFLESKNEAVCGLLDCIKYHEIQNADSAT